jgi:hypothetical protein
MKEVKEKDGQFLSSMLFFSLPQCDYNHNKKKMDTISIILPYSSICFQPLMSLPLSHDHMASPSGNHEDKDNEGNIDIPSTTSAFERKMLEYMATQTQTLQAMTQIMVNIHQYIIEQASNPKNSNLVLGDNRQNPFVPPSLDKEKLLVMQAQVLQGQKQTNTSPSHNTKITKAGVPAGPIKKQVIEAWNHQK